MERARTGMMHDSHVLETNQLPKQGYAANHVSCYPTSGITDDGAVKVGAEEALGDTARVEAGH